MDTWVRIKYFGDVQTLIWYVDVSHDGELKRFFRPDSIDHSHNLVFGTSLEHFADPFDQFDNLDSNENRRMVLHYERNIGIVRGQHRFHALRYLLQSRDVALSPACD